MLEILKLCALAVVGILLALQLKTFRPELSFCLILALGILIFAYSFSSVKTVFDEVLRLGESLGDSAGYLKILIKIVGISYVCEFSAGICRDAGYGTLGEQVEILGKLAILFSGFPILYAMIEQLTHLG